MNNYGLHLNCFNDHRSIMINGYAIEATLIEVKTSSTSHEVVLKTSRGISTFMLSVVWLSHYFLNLINENN